MKRLIIIRHGKSSWKHNVDDHQRPLKKRAYKDAEKVISALQVEFEKPTALWSSSATRALESAKIFRESLGIAEENFVVRKDLYTFEAASLLEIISSCNDEVDQLMIFGHNPAVTEVVNSLGDQYFDNIPTTGACVIDFNEDSWQDIKNGQTLLSLFPKYL